MLVLGLTQEVETEKHDRVSIDLPGYQEQLATAVVAAARANVPVVAVLLGGGPTQVSALLPPSTTAPGAVVWAGYPGEAGGAGIADVLFGSVSPAGRLTVTWPASVHDLPKFQGEARSRGQLLL